MDIGVGLNLRIRPWSFTCAMMVLLQAAAAAAAARPGSQCAGYTISTTGIAEAGTALLHTHTNSSADCCALCTSHEGQPAMVPVLSFCSPPRPSHSSRCLVGIER